MDSMGECLPWLRTIFLNWSLFLRSNLCDTVMAWLYPPPSDRWGSAGPSVRPPGEHSVTHPLAPACRPLPLICSFCLLTPDSVRAESLNFFTGLCRTSGSLCTFGRPGRAGRCLWPLCQDVLTGDTGSLLGTKRCTGHWALCFAFTDSRRLLDISSKSGGRDTAVSLPVSSPLSLPPLQLMPPTLCLVLTSFHPCLFFWPGSQDGSW